MVKPGVAFKALAPRATNESNVQYFKGYSSEGSNGGVVVVVVEVDEAVVVAEELFVIVRVETFDEPVHDAANAWEPPGSMVQFTAEL